MKIIGKSKPKLDKYSSSSASTVILLVLLFTITQMLPAIINGYPFVFFDTRGYHNAGRAVLETLFETLWLDSAEKTAELQTKDGRSAETNLIKKMGDSPSISMSRSPYYGFVVYLSFISEIFLLVFFQSLIIAYSIWLVVKNVCPENSKVVYLTVGVMCALLTPLPYFSAYIMPDIFVALIPICIFLLCFAISKLSFLEILFCWLAITATVSFHSSHLLLCIGLLMLLLFLHYLSNFNLSLKGWLISFSCLLLGILALFLFSYVSQIVFGSSPKSLPFLTARGLEDGPIAELITKGCNNLSFAICEATSIKNYESQHFLWSPEGFYQSASSDTKQQLSNEDLNVFLTAALEYPKIQFQASFKNFLEQLSLFGVSEFETSSRVYLESAPYYMDNENLKRFQKSLAVSEIYPFSLISIVVYGFSFLSLFVVVILLKSKKLSSIAVSLAITIFFALILNAGICGILSDPHHRYQARIIWLLPFISILFCLNFFQRHRIALGIKA